MSRIIGVDLGTSNSVMAVMAGQQPAVLPNAEGERLTPSVVAWDEASRQVIVGTRALKRATTDYQRVVYSAKRFVGRFSVDPEIQRDLDLAPFAVGTSTSGGVSLQMGPTEYSPAEVLAKILGKLKQDSAAQLGEPASRAVIAVPAYYDDRQRQATKEAARLAGLEPVRMINEPTAACLAYGLHTPGNHTVAVYHLGGGTLDVSVVQFGQGV